VITPQIFGAICIILFFFRKEAAELLAALMDYIKGGSR